MSSINAIDVGQQAVAIRHSELWIELEIRTRNRDLVLLSRRQVDEMIVHHRPVKVVGAGCLCEDAAAIRCYQIECRR